MAFDDCQSRTYVRSIKLMKYLLFLAQKHRQTTIRTTGSSTFLHHRSCRGRHSLQQYSQNSHPTVKPGTHWVQGELATWTR